MQWAEFLSLLIAEVLRNFSGRDADRVPRSAKVRPINLPQKIWVKSMIGVCSRLGWVNDQLDKTKKEIENAISVIRVETQGMLPLDDVACVFQKLVNSSHAGDSFGPCPPELFLGFFSLGAKMFFLFLFFKRCFRLPAQVE